MPCINQLNPQLYKYFLKGAAFNFKRKVIVGKPGIKFEKKNLVGANLAQSNLKMSAILKSDSKWANFEQSNLQYGQLHKTNFANSNFESAIFLNTAILDDNDFNKVNFLGADIRGANLTKFSNLESAFFEDAKYNTIEFILNGITYSPTKFPPDFDPVAAGMIEQNHL